MANFPVKWFSSDMVGAPTLGDETAGDFNALLKACLVTGFNVTPVTEMSYDASTGEVTITAGTDHGFIKHQVIAVSGADQAEYNGEHRVTAIGTDWLTFAPDSAPSAATATGATLEVKAAPHGGWEVVDEDAANYLLAVRSTRADATGYIMRIQNDAWDGDYSRSKSNIARVAAIGPEAFTDISTYTAAMQQNWPASHRRADTDSEDWLLVCDGALLYFIVGYGRYNKRSCMVFGDIESVRPGDAHQVILNGIEVGLTAEWDSRYESPYSGFPRFSTSDYRSIARPYSMLPGSTSWTMEGIGEELGGPMTYPNPQTNGFYVATGKLLLLESGGLRGFMPGLIQPLQSSQVYDKAVLNNLPGLEDTPVLFCQAARTRSAKSPDRLMGFRLDSWRAEVA